MQAAIICGVGTCAALAAGIWDQSNRLASKPWGASARVNQKLGIPPRNKQLTVNVYEGKLMEHLWTPQEIDVNFGDVAGVDDVLEQLQFDARVARVYARNSSSSMMSPSKGVLLYGPPGTGKTTIAKVQYHAVDHDATYTHCKQMRNASQEM
jgi:flagellar biosynthesis GTPase FlhF